MAKFTSLFNYFFRNINDYSYHSEKQQKLSPQTKNKLLAAYQESIGLPQDKIGTKKHAENYLIEREKSLTITGYPLTSFVKKPNINNMEKTFGALDDCLKEIGGKYHPDSLSAYLQEERTKAITEIKEQQTADINALKALINLDSPDEQAKKLSALSSSQKTQLEAFEKALNADITALHKAAQHERDRVFIFAALRQGNEEIQQKIDKAYSVRKNKNAAFSSVLIKGNETLKDWTLDQMIDNINDERISDVQKNFKSLTGQFISAEKTANGTYTFSMVYPNTVSSLYYSDRSNRSKVDALVMANLLKLSGEENPVVEVNGFQKNPKIALKIARDLYEATREVGYPEKNITVLINGKKYTPDELFKDAPNRHQEMQQRIQASSVGANDQTAMKKEMDNLRKSKLQQTTPTGTPPSTGVGRTPGTGS